MKTQVIFLAYMLVVASTDAEVLTSVPRQGGMLMPQVYYHADSDSVSVDLSHATNIVPQLTPLLVSNPGARFSPDAPWFEDLDPSRLGLAFSRRYGWEMDAMSDLLPEDRAIWIRKLDSTPGLSFYDYIDNQWNPIFGAPAATNACQWDGEMWHFGVAAPPGTNRHWATFEIIVVNRNTGQEIAGSSSGPFTLTWTDVPDDRPPLTIQFYDNRNTIVTWHAANGTWSLESTTNLASPIWTAWTNTTLQGSIYSIVVPHTYPEEFFRLKLFP